LWLFHQAENENEEAEEVEVDEEEEEEFALFVEFASCFDADT
jgi:hypothetical protein